MNLLWFCQVIISLWNNKIYSFIRKYRNICHSTRIGILWNSLYLSWGECSDNVLKILRCVCGKSFSFQWFSNRSNPFQQMCFQRIFQTYKLKKYREWLNSLIDNKTLFRTSILKYLFNISNNVYNNWYIYNIYWKHLPEITMSYNTHK